MTDEIKIGSILWEQDSSRRQYDESNRLRYEGTFTDVEVCGESRTSWYVASPGSPHITNPPKDYRYTVVNKETMWQRTGVNHAGSVKRYFTAQGMADDIWIQANRAKIVRDVQACKSADLLKRIAALLAESKP